MTPGSASATRPGKPTLAAVAYLALVAGLLYLGFAHWGYDDPYITYRYAENLSRGRGFVYNPGERVLSTTTPLMALTLAALRPLWSDLPKLAVAIGALSLAAGALLLWDLARTWKAPLVGWAALALYPSFPLLVNTLSSETPVYLALCLGAYAAFARRRYTLTGLSAGLAILARPDGGVVLALLAGAILFRERRLPPGRSILAAVLPVLGWVAFAWRYFGSPIPATLAAKQGQGAMAISRTFLQGFPGLLEGYSHLPHYLLEASLAVLGLTLIWRGARQWALFFVWPVLYFAAYSSLSVSAYFWYYAPLVPGLLVLAGLGLQFIWKIFQTRAGALPDGIPTTEANNAETPVYLPGGQPALPGKARIFLKQPVNLLVIGMVAGLALAQLSDVRRLRALTDTRLVIYRAVGAWFHTNTPPQARVGALEVGIIGYYAGNTMVDFAGLIQPTVADRLGPQSTYEDAALWAVDHYHPEYLALHDGLMPALEAGYVQEHCLAVTRFPGDDFAYPTDLVIYACQT